MGGPTCFFANDCSHGPSKHHALSSCSARWPSAPHDRRITRLERPLVLLLNCLLSLLRDNCEARNPSSRPPFIGFLCAKQTQLTLIMTKAVQPFSPLGTRALRAATYNGSHSFSSRIDPPPSRLTTSRVWLDVKKAPRRTNREHPALSLADLINTHGRTRVSRPHQPPPGYHQPREWSISGGGGVPVLVEREADKKPPRRRREGQRRGPVLTTT